MRKKTIVLLAFALIVFSAFFLRFYNLDAFILHHDEGVHGFLSEKLFNGGTFHYDPANYHGPVMFYLNVVSFKLFGVSIFSLRFMAALLGAGIVLLLFPLRKHFGNVFLLAASVLAAFSPTLVYYSRMSLSVSYFLFFSFASLVLFLLFLLEKKPAWLYLFAFVFALAFATKETIFINILIFAVFIAVFFIHNRFFSKTRFKLKAGFKAVAVSTCIFAATYIALFSSFFADLDGVRRSLLAPFIYASGKAVSEHVKPLPYFFDVFLKYEPLLFAVSVFAIIYCLYRRKDLLHWFLAFWYIATFAFYSIMPYKTTWLVVYIVLPGILLSAYYFERIGRKISKPLLAVMLILIIAFSLYMVFETSFVHFNDERQNKLAYVHTTSEIYAFLSFLEEYSLEREKVVFEINHYGQWPLPWYFMLRNYAVKKDNSLWSLIRAFEKSCQSDSNSECILLSEKIKERLEELGNPLILGGKSELKNLEINGYSRIDFEIRKNAMIRIFYKLD